MTRWRTQATWSTDPGDSGVATGTTAWTIGAVPLGAGITVVTVAARDAAGNTSRATLAVTYITPPGPATLVAPMGVIAEATPSFTWAAVSGATEYLLWVNLAGRPGVIKTTYTATAAGCAAGTGTCTVSPGVMLPPGLALWWIPHGERDRQGSWSSALAFTAPPSLAPGARLLVDSRGEPRRHRSVEHRVALPPERFRDYRYLLTP